MASLKNLGCWEKVSKNKPPSWCGSAAAQSKKTREIAEARERRKKVAGKTCAYCGVATVRKFGPTFGTVDHLKPVALGGTDSEENLVWSCFRCNFEKGSLFFVPDLSRVARNVLKARWLHWSRGVDSRLATLRSRCVNWLAQKGRT